MTQNGTRHGTAVIIGTAGILIRGPSGSGKSMLALALIDRARAEGRFAALVADDRVILSAENGRLIARAPDTLAGLVELRGRGIVAVPHEPAARLRLVLDITSDPERMPEPHTLETTIEGIMLARRAVPCDRGAALILADEALQACKKATVTPVNSP